MQLTSKEILQAEKEYFAQITDQFGNQSYPTPNSEFIELLKKFDENNDHSFMHSCSLWHTLENKAFQGLHDHFELLQKYHYHKEKKSSSWLLNVYAHEQFFSIASAMRRV